MRIIEMFADVSRNSYPDLLIHSLLLTSVFNSLIKEFAMLRKIDPTTTQSWKKLAGHYQEMKTVHMKALFAADPDRFAKFSLRFNDILVDYSKNIITEETKALLISIG